MKPGYEADVAACPSIVAVAVVVEEAGSVMDLLAS